MNSSISMKFLKKGFVNNGYDVHCFDYKSRQYSNKTLLDLDNLIKSIDYNEIYLIGHSMGGLIARNYISNVDLLDKRIKSIVTISTPHYQSICAKSVENWLGDFLGTAGTSGLTKKIKDWENKIPIGCIAGLDKYKINANLFLLFNKRKGLNDGTVFVDEAILKNCKDSIVLNGSHTGLLFKKNVYKQCIYFIENNKFNHTFKNN